MPQKRHNSRKYGRIWHSRDNIYRPIGWVSGKSGITSEEYFLSDTEEEENTKPEDSESSISRTTGSSTTSSGSTSSGRLSLDVSSDKELVLVGDNLMEKTKRDLKNLKGLDHDINFSDTDFWKWDFRDCIYR